MLKPIWAEGRFLSQHHFQAHDRYHEGLIRDRVATLRRFDWGVLKLDIDERQLQAGELRLQRLDAIWPDGLVVRCGGTSETPAPAPRSFQDAFPPETEHLDVFAGIMAEEAALPNIAGRGEVDSYRRFDRIRRIVQDYEAGGAPQDIELAVPKVRILFGSELRQNVSVLHVARLRRGLKGQIGLDETFVPPSLHASAAPFLVNGLQQVLGALTSRQRELATARKLRNATHVEPHVADARALWMLHTLNSAIPVLSHLLGSRGAHPEDSI